MSKIREFVEALLEAHEEKHGVALELHDLCADVSFTCPPEGKGNAPRVYYGVFVKDENGHKVIDGEGENREVRKETYVLFF